MTTTRTRSQDRLGPEAANDAGLGRLSELLERMWTRQTRPEPFKAPQFDGKGEVTYFIQQFEDVANANRWEPVAALLHLRESLKGIAQEYGKAATVDGVFESLRARFGLTAREARTKLGALKRGYKVTLQEHAAEVDKLVEIAYADLPGHRAAMTMELFQSTIGNAFLQRHLLAVNPQTLADAVRARNEYLKIQPGQFGTNAHDVDLPELGHEAPELGHVSNIAMVTNDPFEMLNKTLQRLVKEVEELKKGANNRQINLAEPVHDKRSTVCWGCQLEGHVRSACPTKPWQKKQEISQQGNGYGPQ